VKNILIKNYTEALFKESAHDFELIKSEISAFAELFLTDADLYNALVSDIMKENIKFKILNSIFKLNKLTTQTQNFLLLLVKNKRFSIFLDVAQKFNKLQISGANIISAKVTSSVELSSDEKKQVVQMLEDKFGNKFEISTKVDSTILAGLVIEYGSIFLDLSLKGQIEMIMEHSSARLQSLAGAL
jgi:F-type H+-transporting ATPase subunit delta